MARGRVTAPPEWIAGDCHLHTRYSDGNWNPIQLREAAMAAGHSFAYVTDHVDLVDDDRRAHEWTRYCAFLRGASTPGFTFAPGLEVTCRDKAGDCLVLGLPISAEPLLVNKQSDCAATVAAIRSHPGATATVAHPFGIGVHWRDPHAGHGAAQVAGCFHGARRFWQTAHERGERIAAVGGSDSSFRRLGLGAVTWVHAPAWAGAETWEAKVAAIAAAIRGGQTCAAERPNLAWFTCDGQLPGGELSVPVGSSVAVRLNFRPVDGGRQAIVRWEFCAGNRRLHRGVTGPLAPGQPATVDLSITAERGTSLYSLVCAFHHPHPLTRLSWSWHTFCGPTSVIA